MNIFVIGRAGSGKNYVCNLLKSKWFSGAAYIDVSDIVSRIARASKDERDKLQDEIKKHKDPDWLFRELEREINRYSHSDNIIIGGLREPYLLHRIINTFHKDSVVLRLNVEDWLRYFRLCTRDGYISIEDFNRLEEKDNYLGLNLLMEMSSTEFQAETGVALTDVKAGKSVDKELDLSLFKLGYIRRKE